MIIVIDRLSIIGKCACIEVTNSMLKIEVQILTDKLETGIHNIKKGYSIERSIGLRVEIERKNSVESKWRKINSAELTNRSYWKVYRFFGEKAELFELSVEKNAFNETMFGADISQSYRVTIYPEEKYGTKPLTSLEFCVRNKAKDNKLPICSKDNKLQDLPPRIELPRP
jgi:hypothetical protein